MMTKEERKEYDRAYRAKNGVAIRAYHLAWSAANKEKIAVGDKLAYIDRRAKSREKVALACAQDIATRRITEDLT